MAAKSTNEKLSKVETNGSLEFKEYTVKDLSQEFPDNTLNQLVESFNNEEFQVLFDLAEETGAEFYLTGGIVRDSLIGEKPKDYDFIIRFPDGAENGREVFEDFFGEKTYEEPKTKKKKGKPEPEQETELKWKIYGKYGKLVLAGEGFGVYKFYPKGWPPDAEPIDMCFPRTEESAVGSVGGARDFGVQVNPTLPVIEDVKRRDFTVNSLLLKIGRDKSDELTGVLIDHFGGVEDLKRQCLRAVGSAKARLNEDKTRVMRAVRFEVQKGLPMDQELEDAVRELGQDHVFLHERPDSKLVVPPESSAVQFLKSFSANPAQMIQRMQELGLLEDFLPDLYDFRPLDKLPRGLDNRQELVENKNPNRNQEIRRESLDKAVQALKIHQEQYPDAEMEEYLFLLFHELGKSAALEEVKEIETADGEIKTRVLFKPEYRQLSSAYLQKIIRENRFDNLEGNAKIRPDREKLKSWFKREQEALGLLSPELIEVPTEKLGQYRHHLLKIFPELTKDPVWRLLQTDILTTPDAEVGRSQLVRLKQQLIEIEQTFERTPTDLENLLTTIDLKNLFGLKEGPHIGRLYEYAQQTALQIISETDEFISDQAIKRRLLANLFNQPDLYAHWRPWRPTVSPTERMHLLKSDEIALFSLPQGQDEDEPELDNIQEGTTRMLMRALERTVCENYLGVSFEQAVEQEPELAKVYEGRHQGKETFGHRFAQKLAEKPDEVIHWLDRSFKTKESLAAYLLPEIKKMDGCTQDAKYHSEGDVWTHTRLLFAKAKEQELDLTPELALSLLLHDVGKSATRTEDGDRIHFIDHEQIGVEKFQDLAERLGLVGTESLDLSEVERAIRDHGLFYTAWRNGKLRLLDVRNHLPNGSEDIVYQVMVCDSAARLPASGERDDADLLTEIKAKADLVEKEKKYPGYFEQLIESPTIKQVLGAREKQNGEYQDLTEIGEIDEKLEIIYGEFLNLLNGTAPDENELKMKFLTSSEKWTREYVKNILAPGRVMIEHGLPAGPAIGAIQGEIAKRILSGQTVTNQEVDALIAQEIARLELA